LVEFRGCNFNKLNRAKFVEAVLVQAAWAAEATVLHSFSHQFEPQGVTAFVALAESHVSAHCWPECGYAAIDIFLCGKMDPDRVLEDLVKTLKPESYDVKREIRK